MTNDVVVRDLREVRFLKSCVDVLEYLVDRVKREAKIDVRAAKQTVGLAGHILWCAKMTGEHDRLYIETERLGRVDEEIRNLKGFLLGGLVVTPKRGDGE